ncbi:MAG: preprotein translocase subunit SecE [bacterium]|nr:preprotein translocase subunit SecE [bacterium]
MSAITNYINDAIAELHHVRWPTRQQSIRLSTIVLIFVAVSSGLFGFLDYLLAQGVRFLLSLV